jgi:penicillin-binding protein 1A
VILILTALIALSHFNTKLPNLNDLQTKSQPEIVRMYSNACMDFLAGPGGEYDVTDVIDKALAATNLFQQKRVAEKIEYEQIEVLFKKICRKDPDPAALDSLAGEFPQAIQKFLELKKGLPSVDGIKTLKLPQSIELKASSGQTVAEIFEKNGRRKWISIKELPPYLPKAVVAVEDRRFFQHKGIDELGILRAALKTGGTGRPEGASTITQQVARNLYLNDSLSFERKIREIMLAGEIEARLSKQEILEIYLNLVYFGRTTWGIAKAAEAYFHKPAGKLNIIETTFLTGLIHGPNLYQTMNARTRERMNFVLAKLVEEKVIESESNLRDQIKNFAIPLEENTLPANYFKEFLLEELKARGSRGTQLEIQTTLNTDFQKSAQAALQEVLLKYENEDNWRGPIANISATVSEEMQVAQRLQDLRKLEEDKLTESLFSQNANPSTSAELKISPPWLFALARASTRVQIPVATWQLAVVLDDVITVGLMDGSIGKLSQASREWVRPIHFGDLVYVRKASVAGIYEIQQVPLVDGAVVAMDVQTGEVLAMVGGFSPSGSWNRAVRALRQPGSLVKPFTYMAALQFGYQPNYMISDEPISFSIPATRQVWAPRNFSDIANGPKPMRWALEQSYNVMAVRMMDKIGLTPIQILTRDFGLYSNPSNNYAFVLGSQEANLLSLVKSYAAIANGGFLVAPHAVKTPEAPVRKKIKSVDDITLFQIRYLMQGVLERGTGRALKSLSQFAAAKTGTTEDHKDAWFVGFTPNVVIGVFIGYDEPKTLGEQNTGGVIALPVFEKILKASFQFYKKQEPFPPPPPGVVFYPTDPMTGQVLTEPSKTSINEAYRASRVVKETSQ